MTRLARGVHMMRMHSLLCCLLLVVIAAPAQGTPNFSGTYALTALKGEHTAKTLPKTTMKVTQNAGSIEIVESFDDGKTLTSKYALDGSESKNLTSGGVPTTDKAEIKGKTLVIRSSYRLSTGDTVHETEKWELSADSKTIKIRHQMQFERMSMLDDTLNETYQRQ
jgi:hypothetical protein